MSEMMLRLTRVTGTPISINAGVIASCEEMDGHTVIVIAGDEPDVYHVLEAKDDVERMINIFLRKLIQQRLERMEADPKWERIFRDCLQTISGIGIPPQQMQTVVEAVYQKIAAAYVKSTDQPEDLSPIEAYRKAKEDMYRYNYGGSDYTKMYVEPIYTPPPRRYEPPFISLDRIDDPYTTTREEAIRRAETMQKIAELAKKYGKG